MARGYMPGGGGGGAGSDDVTAVASDVLENTTAIVHNGTDEPTAGTLSRNNVLSVAGGNIPTRGDSGSRLLNVSVTSTSYDSGYYPYAHGAYINVQNKTTTASTGQTYVDPDNNYLLNRVIINPTPSQEKTGTASTGTTYVTPDNGYLLNRVNINPTPSQEKTVTASTSQTSVTPDGGKLLSKVYINPTPSQGKSIGCSTSAQTVYPDSGNLLSSVSIAAIPNQAWGGDVKLTASTTSSNFGASQWALSRHYVYVDVFSW